MKATPPAVTSWHGLTGIPSHQIHEITDGISYAGAIQVLSERIGLKPEKAVKKALKLSPFKYENPGLPSHGIIVSFLLLDVLHASLSELEKVKPNRHVPHGLPHLRGTCAGLQKIVEHEWLVREALIGVVIRQILAGFCDQIDTTGESGNMSRPPTSRIRAVWRKALRKFRKRRGHALTEKVVRRLSTPFLKFLSTHPILRTLARFCEDGYEFDQSLCALKKQVGGEIKKRLGFLVTRAHEIRNRLRREDPELFQEIRRNTNPNSIVKDDSPCKKIHFSSLKSSHPGAGPSRSPSPGNGSTSTLTGVSGPAI